MEIDYYEVRSRFRTGLLCLSHVATVNLRPFTIMMKGVANVSTMVKG